MMYRLLRPLLFLLPTEIAHHVTLALLRITPGFVFRKAPSKPQTVMGLEFANSVGLAAGLDKNGDYIGAFAKLGFGFIEVGTVTPRPQAGNAKPRLFRVTEHQALINRMGFNNKGVDHLVKRIKSTKYKGILGVNISKNTDTPLEEALEDYLYCLRQVYPHASYITLNISSPNSPELRKLQFGEHCQNLLSALKVEQAKLKKRYYKYVPLVVKIAPDLSDEELKQIADCLLANHIDAVIATNATVSREGLEGAKYAEEKGGLTGKPLAERSNNIIKQLAKLLQGKVPIIGLGGIMSGEDASQKIKAGAKLVQIYTGLIYEGPGLINDIKEALDEAQ